MMATRHGLRADAERIWQEAIGAVAPQRLLALALADLLGSLPAGRIVVVGAGKAAAAMAAGLEEHLAAAGFPPERLSGLVSVPEGCGRKLRSIEVRQTRPAGVNLPTPRVVTATAAMMTSLGGLGPADLAVALISGGGSALLAAPRDGLALDDKIAVTRFLSGAGADIGALNTVRRGASAVKAGGLARACTAGRLVVLVLSDVIGDPLDLIASGPCMPTPAEPQVALDLLERFGAIAAGIAPRLVEHLRHDLAAGAAPRPSAPAGPNWQTPAGCRVSHRIVGNNDTAVEAAAAAARALGYETTVRHARPGPPASLESAEAIGRRLAAEGLVLAALAARDGHARAVIEGGEATVVIPADHGVGGRNQQTVLAAVASAADWPTGLLVASLGTDGEDGPTDAAGALADADVARILAADKPALERALARCDSLPMLERAGGLVRTGPTGTNVADVRIVLARP
jgi:hydroxypyruvate reductase